MKYFMKGAVGGGGLRVAVAVLCISAPFVRAQDGASRQAAPAEREAAKAYATFLGNRAGEERDYEIAPGVKMTFCWCPEGEFSMGSPESEEFKKDNEYQVKVTLRWGLCDMHGNVYEWCADWYESELPGGVDPRGPDSGTNRVCRGGSWHGKAHYCRSATRSDGPRPFFVGSTGSVLPAVQVPKASSPTRVSLGSRERAVSGS